jgi:hypothetical protein
VRGIPLLARYGFSGASATRNRSPREQSGRPGRLLGVDVESGRGVCDAARRVPETRKGSVLAG